MPAAPLPKTRKQGAKTRLSGAKQPCPGVKQTGPGVKQTGPGVKQTGPGVKKTGCPSQVEVQRCPLLSHAGSLRSSSAHCMRKLAKSWQSGRQLRSSSAHCMRKLAKSWQGGSGHGSGCKGGGGGSWRRGRRRRRRRRTTVIKSKQPSPGRWGKNRLDCHKELHLPRKTT